MDILKEEKYHEKVWISKKKFITVKYYYQNTITINSPHPKKKTVKLIYWSSHQSKD